MSRIPLFLISTEGKSKEQMKKETWAAIKKLQKAKKKAVPQEKKREWEIQLIPTYKPEKREEFELYLMPTYKPKKKKSQ